MILSLSELQAIDDLQEANLNIQAYKRAEKFGKFSEWEGTEALIAASHLAYALGAPEESFRLTSRAWHRDKANEKAVFYYAIELLQRRGPLPALVFMRRYPNFEADEKLQSWWYSLLGQIHSTLRDFDIAESWHKKAEAACPTEPWVWTSRSFTFEQQDRYEEALDAARRGLELRPNRRSTVSSVVHFLLLQEKDDEALSLLSSTVNKVENAWLVKELSDLQSELGMHHDAYATLKQCFDLLPMMEKKTGEWLYGSLSDLAYLIGDTGAAVDFAEKASNEFHKKIAENLRAASPDAKRKVLDVGFLRQHHVTCAPATLSNIARYWKKKADHLEVVEEICYDGTPSYKERNWAENNGWQTREFTLNWDDAVAMIDAGVPFTLATVYPGGGHLQAIIGYDAARGTYLVRDPYYRRTGEFLAKELLETQKANGPRVMALAPSEHAAKLGKDANFLESEIYDLVYQVESALEDHNREAASAALAELDGKFPIHRLNHVAHWSASNYDSRNLGVRAAMQELLKQFPDDVNLRLSDLSISALFTGRAERLAKLEEYATAEKSDPLIWQMFGYELGFDAKQHKRALRWLIRSLRRSPANGLTFKFIADILWSQRRFDEAAELYRFASSLNDKDEQLAYSYFLAMRFLKREDEAVDVLRERFRRFGKQSSMPVRSLFSALRELGCVGEAFESLEQGIELLPEDGDLKLFAAEMRARYGRFDLADEMIASATPVSPRPRWLRASAFVDQLKGELETALNKWSEVAKVDPSALDTHENIAFLKMGAEGATGAKEYLRKICRKFPTNRNLQTLRLQYLNEEPTEAIAVLRDLLRRDPDDIWCWRELSHWYVEVGRYDKALETAEKGLSADPNDATSHWFVGRAKELLKRYAEASESYRSAIALGADQTFAIRTLLSILRSVAAKREALDFVWAQLNSQTTMGDSLFAYRDEARRVIDRVTLLNQLKEFASANKRSWFASSALVQQLAEMGRSDEALSIATEATERFPLVKEVWLDLALVHRLKGRSEEEIAALATAVSASPVWSVGIQQLADAYQRSGRFAESRDCLLEGLTRLPFDNYLLGYLADAYWSLGDREKAIETAKKAVEIEPDYQWAWAAIRRWSEQIGDRALPVELARELTRRKPKDIRAWINLAEMLDNGVFSDERMQVIGEALKLDAFNSTALALKANALSDARKFDEAIDVARTKMPDGHRPEQLRFVEAGIEMMRGRNLRSVDVLVELTESSPGYLPGWSRLADIYRNDPDRNHEYRKAAIEMVRLAPRDATVYGYLAESCLRLDLKDEARDALQQAVILDPTYEYAVVNLFGLLTEGEDLSDAEQLVQNLIEVSPLTGLPVAVELAVKQKDKAKTAAYLERLFRNRDVQRDRLDRVVESAVEFFGRKDRSILEILERVAASGEANPVAGRYLIDAAYRAEKLKGCRKRLDFVSDDEMLWAHAASRHMELLAGETLGGVAKFIDQNGEKLQKQTESWGAVAYQLSNLTDLKRMHRWFEGWQSRPDVMPWMLWNYTIVLRRNGQTEKADEINAAALRLMPDETVNLHLMTLGLTEFARGDFGSAASILSQINSGSMTQWDRFFYDVLGEAVLTKERLDHGDPDAAGGLVESIVAKMVAFDPKAKDRMLQDLSRGVLRVILPMIGSSWFSFRMKAKLLYYRFV